MISAAPDASTRTTVIPVGDRPSAGSIWVRFAIESAVAHAGSSSTPSIRSAALAGATRSCGLAAAAVPPTGVVCCASAGNATSTTRHVSRGIAPQTLKVMAQTLRRNVAFSKVESGDTNLYWWVERIVCDRALRLFLHTCSWMDYASTRSTSCHRPDARRHFPHKRAVVDGVVHAARAVSGRCIRTGHRGRGAVRRVVGQSHAGAEAAGACGSRRDREASARAWESGRDRSDGRALCGRRGPPQRRLPQRPP